MATIDYIVLIGYFILITLFGIWISRKIRTSDSYFRGDRKFKWYIMIGQAFGVGTHAEMPVAQTGATFSNGFATIWYQWKNMLITPFYWLIAPFYRRSDNRRQVRQKNGTGLFGFCHYFFCFQHGGDVTGRCKSNFGCIW